MILRPFSLKGLEVAGDTEVFLPQLFSVLADVLFIGWKKRMLTLVAVLLTSFSMIRFCFVFLEALFLVVHTFGSVVA